MSAAPAHSGDNRSAVDQKTFAAWLETDRPALAALRASVTEVFRGKGAAVDLALTALLARGHILCEDVPGTGKTTLARAVAASLDARFRRIQFTSDLLPSDVIGISVFQNDREGFDFRARSRRCSRP